ncbi:MAG: response regulator transcription factor [Spirochaetaceae bacterium]
MGFPGVLRYITGAMTVFLVEDDELIRTNVAEYLRLADFSVVAVASGNEARAVLDSSEHIDLAILDVSLPDVSGFWLAKTVRRSRRAGLPVIFLTARDDETSRITGFELGADDYVVKPFSPKELVMRVQAILRRSTPPAADQPETRESTLRYESDGHMLELEMSLKRSRVDDRTVHLTHTEWCIMEWFIAHPDMVLSRSVILESILDYEGDLMTRTADAHISNLRSKLTPGTWIETVRGFGYRFSGTRRD